MKLKSNYIIDNRNKLSKDITHYWTILRRENLINKEESRNYNMDELANQIKQKGGQRVKVKLLLQAINMGYSVFEYTKFKDETNWEAIFTLSELNEQFTQWDIIHKYATLNPVLKAKKGKSVLSKSEHFTFAKIRAIKKKLELEINALNKKIEDFNNNAEIEAGEEYRFILAA